MQLINISHVLFLTCGNALALNVSHGKVTVLVELIGVEDSIGLASADDFRSGYKGAHQCERTGSSFEVCLPESGNLMELCLRRTGAEARISICEAGKLSFCDGAASMVANLSKVAG